MLEVEDWESGARFASEREIEEEFGVSRAVIRPALDLLVGDGAIYRIKGSGAFVAPPRREIKVAGLVRLLLEHNGDRPIAVHGCPRRSCPITPFRTSSGSRTNSNPVAHVTAVVDVGEPSVCLVDSYSTVAHVPWFLPTAEALKAGEKPPAPGGLELTRRHRLGRAHLLRRVGILPGRGHRRRAGPDGALRPVRPRQRIGAGAPARVRPPHLPRRQRPALLRAQLTSGAMTC